VEVLSRDFGNSKESKNGFLTRQKRPNVVETQ
jgi:hypothetical protein